MRCVCNSWAGVGSPAQPACVGPSLCCSGPPALPRARLVVVLWGWALRLRCGDLAQVFPPSLLQGACRCRSCLVGLSGGRCGCGAGPCPPRDPAPGLPLLQLSSWECLGTAPSSLTFPAPCRRVGCRSRLQVRLLSNESVGMERKRAASKKGE